MHDPHPITYRPEIDGLRAIAILSVLLFHFFPKTISGGFVGVDIFFVISGYLISTIIFTQHANGSFSFLNFYARRVRRIFPALIVVLITVHGLGQFLLLTPENKELTKHVIRSSLFILNFTLSEGIGYFETSAESKPLLHLWSLAVEEQFYILFPLIFVICSISCRNFGNLVVAGLILSFAACVVLTPNNPNAAFYLPFTRFWEIFVGVAIAYYKWDKTPYSPTSGNLLAVLGASLIIIAVLTLDLHSDFPGYWALMPTLGSGLIIVAGGRSWLIRQFLARPGLVFVGLISYPLYLWHWPLLSIATITEGTNLSIGLKVAIAASSFVLAWLTYRFVEIPIRRPGKLMPKFAGLGAVMTAILLVALVAQKSDGVLFPSATTAFAESEQFDWKHEYRFGRCFVDALDENSGAGQFSKECSGVGATGTDRPHVIIWGDSHAASLYPGLKDYADKANFDLGQYNAAACPPVVGFTVKRRPECRSINDFVLAEITRLKPDFVVMGAYWGLFNGKDGWEELKLTALEATIKLIQDIGKTKVILFLHLPIFTIDQPRIAIKTLEKAKQVRTYRSFRHDVKKLDLEIRKIGQRLGIGIVSPISLTCNEDGCQVSASRTKVVPVAWDYAHLTNVGSRLLIARAIRNGALHLRGANP